MQFTRLDLLYGFVPLLLLMLLIRWKRKRSYVSHPLLFFFRNTVRPSSPLVHLPGLLELLALGALLLALLGPVTPSTQYRMTREGLDIVLVLDLSGSMNDPLQARRVLGQRYWDAASREKSRLDVVKEAMIGFIRKRQSDRIGLVVFSRNGYVVAPMTTDNSYLIQYLKMVDRSTLAGEGQTGIGEGILSAIQLAAQQSYPRNGNKSRLIVVFTDGENNVGRDPYGAIQEAGTKGFKIYFMGIELERTLDAPRIISAVQATGGNHYDVRDSEQITRAYLDIDRLEKGTFLTTRHLAYSPRYHPFALASVLLLFASIALRAIPYFTEIS
jgi:Ca-activated chloride channel family protein